MESKCSVPPVAQIDYSPGDLVEVIADWGELSLMPSPKIGSLGVVVTTGFVGSSIKDATGLFLTILVDGKMYEMLKTHLTKKQEIGLNPGGLVRVKCSWFDYAPDMMSYKIRSPGRLGLIVEKFSSMNSSSSMREYRYKILIDEKEVIFWGSEIEAIN